MWGLYAKQLTSQVFFTCGEMPLKTCVNLLKRIEGSYFGLSYLARSRHMYFESEEKLDFLKKEGEISEISE